MSEQVGSCWKILKSCCYVAVKVEKHCTHSYFSIFPYDEQHKHSKECNVGVSLGINIAMRVNRNMNGILYTQLL